MLQKYQGHERWRNRHRQWELRVESQLNEMSDSGQDPRAAAFKRRTLVEKLTTSYDTFNIK